VPEVNVLLLAKVYSKDEKDNLTAAEKKVISSLAADLKHEIRQQFGSQGKGR